MNHNKLDVYANKNISEFIRVDSSCPVYMYISGLRQKSSQQTARSVLQSVARHLNQDSIYDIQWAKFDLNTMNQLVIILQGTGLAPDTVVLYAAIVKGVLKKAYLLELISRLQYERVCAVNLPLSGGKKTHQIISFEDFELFLAQFNGQLNAQRRNMAIFSLLIGCGLRRFEITNLMMSNLDLANSRLKFAGKGGKVRQVPMHVQTLNKLNRWLKVRGTIRGPVFVRVYKNDAIDNSYQNNIADKSLTDYCLSKHSIYLLCKKFGLINQFRHIPPHSIRRSYATKLYSNNVDLKTIANLMGHSSIKTTEVYVHIAQDQMDEAINNSLF